MFFVFSWPESVYVCLIALWQWWQGTESFCSSKFWFLGKLSTLASSALTSLEMWEVLGNMGGKGKRRSSRNPPRLLTVLSTWTTGVKLKERPLFYQEVRSKCWFPIYWATKSVRSSLYESVSQHWLEHIFLSGHLFSFLELFLCAVSVLEMSSRLPDCCPVDVYHDLRCTSIFTMIGCLWVYMHPYLLCVFL